MNPLPLVLGEIRRGLPGFLAVTLLIALAVGLGVAVSAQERALRKSSAAAAAPFDLVIGAPGSPTQLILTTVYLQPAALDLVPGSVLQRLQKEPGAAYVAPVAFGDVFHGFPDRRHDGGVRHAWAEGATSRKAASSANSTRRWSAPRLPSRSAMRSSPCMAAAAELAGAAPVHHGFSYIVTGRLPATGTALGPRDPRPGPRRCGRCTRCRPAMRRRTRNAIAIGPPWSASMCRARRPSS